MLMLMLMPMSLMLVSILQFCGDENKSTSILQGFLVGPLWYGALPETKGELRAVVLLASYRRSLRALQQM